VIVDCQRIGPATGGASSVAQGDVQLVRWGSSGGYPVIVLCPASLADCFRLTCKAFDLAERFRTPVFLATDKEMLATNTTVPVESLRAAPVRERRLASEVDDFVPYRIDSADDVPPMSPFGGAHILRFSTSVHDEQGYMNKDHRTMGRLNEHLWAKIMQHVDETVDVQVDLQPGASTLVVGYGITAQAVMAAVGEARTGGQPLSAMVLSSLWPLPETAIRTALQGIERVLVPELNHGQYRREIERLASAGQQVLGLNRVDGELITPGQILEQV
jgi:2-oxoglutarate ferredoxin oxidoreductase subunit alpha